MNEKIKPTMRIRSRYRADTSVKEAHRHDSPRIPNDKFVRISKLEDDTGASSGKRTLTKPNIVIPDASKTTMERASLYSMMPSLQRRIRLALITAKVSRNEGSLSSIGPGTA
jgi:hypothetical protein